MTTASGRLILVDPHQDTRELVARRLRSQGYLVDEAADPAQGADLALSSPPGAVVADLWMPTISGVQLCRLLQSEPATAEVPVILCGDDEPRNRFWADRAGANAYVSKHRTGDLVRALHRAVRPPSATDQSFFLQLGGHLDVRDRIARHLDEALFDSVIASEVRALAACGAFERLFDLFAQFLSQVCRYRWVAVQTDSPARLGIHHSPAPGFSPDREALEALGLPEGRETEVVRIEDADAVRGEAPGFVSVRAISLGPAHVGKLAISLCNEPDDTLDKLLSLVARELGGPLRMTALVEESQRLALTDPLTRCMNRRAFTAAMTAEIARSQRHRYPLALVLLDIDHFKHINDGHGHAAGDQVLNALGVLLRGPAMRRTDLVARWGGEEFVVAYLSTDLDGGQIAAERLRQAIAELVIDTPSGRVPVTASLGLASLQPGDSLDTLVARADAAMYLAKTSGRNRVQVEGSPSTTPADRP